jgi:hypothetical protein
VPQATMTSLNAILKEVYSVRLQDQINNETVITRRLERTKEGVVETVGGKYVDFPIHIGRNHGIGSRKENEALPNAKSQQFTEVHVPLTYTYGVIRLTGQLIELADTNAQAFTSALDSEMDGIKNDVVFDWERQTLGDGTGLLASVTADGANTVTVDNAASLEIGMQIDIRTRSNGTAVITDREITDINGLVVTYDGADGAATATEGLYRQGNYLGGTARELSGFASIFSDTSTLHDVNPGTATGRKWKATVNANGGVPRALSEGLMIKMVDDVRLAGGGKTSVIFTSLGVRRAYFNLLVQQRRYTDTKNYAGGFQGLSFMHGADIPVVEVPQAPAGTMFFVDESKLKVFRNKEWHWGQEDGNILKWVSGYDAWTAFLKMYSELGTTQRNAMGVLKDLIEG